MWIEPIQCLRLPKTQAAGGTHNKQAHDVEDGRLVGVSWCRVLYGNIVVGQEGASSQLLFADLPTSAAPSNAKDEPPFCVGLSYL